MLCSQVRDWLTGVSVKHVEASTSTYSVSGEQQCMRCEEQLRKMCAVQSGEGFDDTDSLMTHDD